MVVSDSDTVSTTLFDDGVKRGKSKRRSLSAIINYKSEHALFNDPTGLTKTSSFYSKDFGSKNKENNKQRNSYSRTISLHNYQKDGLMKASDKSKHGEENNKTIVSSSRNSTVSLYIKRKKLCSAKKAARMASFQRSSLLPTITELPNDSSKDSKIRYDSEKDGENIHEYGKDCNERSSCIIRYDYDLHASNNEDIIEYASVQQTQLIPMNLLKSNRPSSSYLLVYKDSNNNYPEDDDEHFDDIDLDFLYDNGDFYDYSTTTSCTGTADCNDFQASSKRRNSMCTWTRKQRIIGCTLLFLAAAAVVAFMLYEVIKSWAKDIISDDGQIDNQTSIKRFHTLFINAGYETTYIDDKRNITWLSDENYLSRSSKSSSTLFRGCSKYDFVDDDSNLQWDSNVFCTEREFQNAEHGIYLIPVIDDHPMIYRVRLLWNELLYDQIDMRTFDIYIENNLIESDFDIYRNANRQKHTIVVLEALVNVNDGILDIELIPTKGNAKINAIQVSSTFEDIPSASNEGTIDITTVSHPDLKSSDVNLSDETNNDDHHISNEIAEVQLNPHSLEVDIGNTNASATISETKKTTSDDLIPTPDQSTDTSIIIHNDDVTDSDALNSTQQVISNGDVHLPNPSGTMSTTNASINNDASELSSFNSTPDEVNRTSSPTGCSDAIESDGINANGTIINCAVDVMLSNATFKSTTGENPFTSPTDMSPARTASMYINAGGSEIVTSGDGQLWYSDETYLMDHYGNIYSVCPKAIIQLPIDDINKQIGCSERFFDGTGTFEIPVQAGQKYRYVLYFAELYFDDPGKRIFNVTVESNDVYTNLDIYKESGGKFIAFNVTGETDVYDGALSIQLISVIDHAKINAIEVHPI